MWYKYKEYSPVTFCLSCQIMVCKDFLASQSSDKLKQKVCVFSLRQLLVINVKVFFNTSEFQQSAKKNEKRPYNNTVSIGQVLFHLF